MTNASAGVNSNIPNGNVQPPAPPVSSNPVNLVFPKGEDNTNKWMFVGIVLVLIVGFYFLYKKK